MGKEFPRELLKKEKTTIMLSRDEVDKEQAKHH